MIRSYSRLRRGLGAFERTGETPPDAYKAMRYLHGRTGGRSTDWAAERLARAEQGAGTVAHEGQGLFASLTADQRGALLQDLRRDGLAMSPIGFPADRIEALRAFALATPAHYLAGNKVGAWAEEPARFDPEAPRSNRYQFRLEDLVRCPTAMELAFDGSIAALAQEYLGGDPVLDLVAMWWSAPGFDQLQDAAAQMFHFDLDRLRFVKMFLYLTDVGPENGPHCYVRGSHGRLPRRFRRGGRFDDQMVRGAYGDDAITEVCGPAGTILFADTRGLHKGVPCVSGHRLIFQLEFATSLFGAPVQRVPLSSLPRPFAGQAERMPRRFAGITSPPPSGRP